MKKGVAGIVLIVFAALAVGSGVLSLSLGGYAGVASAPWNRFAAAVGVTLGVEPNPYNTLNDELNAKQAQLDEEQADLAAKEAALASSSGTFAGTAGSSPALGYLVIAVGVLAFFVGMNFYLDWRRMTREAALISRLSPAGGPPVDDIAPPTSGADA